MKNKLKLNLVWPYGIWNLVRNRVKILNEQIIEEMCKDFNEEIKLEEKNTKKFWADGKKSSETEIISRHYNFPFGGSQASLDVERISLRHFTQFSLDRFTHLSTTSISINVWNRSSEATNGCWKNVKRLIHEWKSKDHKQLSWLS